MKLEQLTRILDRKFGEARPVHRCDGGTEIVTTCPYCGRIGHLYANPGKGCFMCQRCGRSGTLRELIGATVPIRVEDLPLARKQKEKTDEPAPYRDAGVVTRLDLLPDNSAARYLRARGFDPAYLGAEYGVCAVTAGAVFMGGRFCTTGCAFFPFVEDGQTLGWICRLPYEPAQIPYMDAVCLGWAVKDGRIEPPPKYCMMPGFDKSNHLFYADRARSSTFVVVCEGVLDAIRVGPPAVAIIGKHPSKRQLELLADGWDTVVLLLDPDARDEQERAADELRDKADVVSVHLEGYKDAGEAPRHEVWRQMIAAAREQGVQLPVAPCLIIEGAPGALSNEPGETQNKE